MTDARALHWYRWISAATGVFMAIAATFSLLPTLGFDSDSLLAIAVPIDILMLAIALGAVWLRPRTRNWEAAPLRAE